MERDEVTRRRFLRDSGLSVALLSIPAGSATCARQGVVPPVEVAASSEAPSLSRLPSMAAQFEVDEAMVSRALSTLGRRDVDRADLYFQNRRSSSILFQDGVVSRATSSVDRGVGLRCVIGERTGYAFTEEITQDALDSAAQTAAAIAREPSQPATPQAFNIGTNPSYYHVEVPYAEVGIDRKLPVVRRAAELARSADESITRVEVSYADSEDQILIIDREGQVVTDRRPMTRLWVSITAERDGVRQSNSANISARHGIGFYTEEQLQLVARQAVERTMILFDASRPPAGEMPVVLVPGPSGILLHEAIGHGMEADFNRKGISIYSEMLGRQVAEPFVTIVDDGTLPHERGALNVDDEGMPCERTVLVEGGRLVNYLHDGISARHYNVAGTGSGRRQSFRHVPIPRMRCTYMENGPHSRDEIIASVRRGILAETFTNGQVRIGAGDYTFYIKNGWLIEDGQLTQPIRDCNIIGNGPETLRRMTMAGDDSRLDTGGWTCGKDGQRVPVSLGIPSLLISSLTVGGENA